MTDDADASSSAGDCIAAGEVLERVFRAEWARVLGGLAARLGDLGVAEEATAEAFAAAAAQWPTEGLPTNPAAWLTVVARRRSVDLLRRDRSRADRVHELGRLDQLSRVAGQALEIDAGGGNPVLEDDRLRLIFTCCHPALGLEAQVALTLRAVAGLTTREIAAAFLVAEATMAQRLVRAKRKIRDAGIEFAMPEAGELSKRLAGVQTVVYLVFTRGYDPVGGSEVVREDLCTEAIWLGRLLHLLAPADPETAGLLALMLLQHSHADARTGPDGRPVSLPEQDRARWDRDAIGEGLALLESALLRRHPGPYQVQAAIAALHARAPTAQATDWSQIADLYGELTRHLPSPVVEINRAVAVGLAHGPQAGLAVLAPLLAAGPSDGQVHAAGPARAAPTCYAPLHAAHADLLSRAGDPAGARGAWHRAVLATGNAVTRSELLRRGAEQGYLPP